jgi:hypothetical protein
VVAERRAALAHEDVVGADAAFAFATTCFISPGARNWPFLMLTGLPARATAWMKSVCRHRNAGVCSTSTTLATGRDLVLVVHVGQDRHAHLAADLGEDAQALVHAWPRKLACELRFALS